MRIRLRSPLTNRHLNLILLALVVGVCSGLGAVAIRVMIKYGTLLFFGVYGNFLESVTQVSVARRLAAPMLGGLIVGPLIYYLAKEAKGHGVPEVMLAVLLRDGRIRKRVAFVKALASAITIGSGGSVGREGPIVQIGSSLGSTIAQRFNLEKRDTATLVACGAAGGIAAAFNAPIAGALFAVEIILGDFGVAALSPIIISSVISTIVARGLEGNLVAFSVPPYALNTPWELIPYTVLGAVAGLVAVLFIVVLYRMEHAYDNWRFPEYLKPFTGGVLVAIICLVFPHMYGVGYDSINGALHSAWPLWVLVAMVFMKIMATSITLASGGSGGVFAPSLFIGASVGGVVGTVTHQLFPQAATSGTYALVGMGAVVAATTQAPITAIIIIFELTQDYHIIPPLMFSCIISTLVASMVKSESIYTQKLKLKGIRLTEGKEESILKEIGVERVMRQGLVFPENMPLRPIIDQVLTSTQNVFPMVNEEGLLRGTLTLGGLKTVFYKRDFLADLVIAKDIAAPPVFLTRKGTLHNVMEINSHRLMEEVPIVNNAREKKYLGMVSVQDVISLYNSEIKKRELALAVVTRKKYKDITEGVSLGEGYRLTELPLPKSFIGKSLKDLAFRNQYNLEIILIKRKGRPDIIPDPDTPLNPGDRIVVVGVLDDIRTFQKAEQVS